jgi:hypothetical protein
MMIVTYALTPCNFSFFENGVLQNKDNGKPYDIFIYHAYTFAFCAIVIQVMKSLE